MALVKLLFFAGGVLPCACTFSFAKNTAFACVSQMSLFRPVKALGEQYSDRSYISLRCSSLTCMYIYVVHKLASDTGILSGYIGNPRPSQACQCLQRVLGGMDTTLRPYMNLKLPPQENEPRCNNKKAVTPGKTCKCSRQVDNAPR